MEDKDNVLQCLPGDMIWNMAFRMIIAEDMPGILVLPSVGEEGQIKLLESSVLVVGAGGLGSPAMMY